MKVHKEGILLERTKHRFERQAVLNPTCIQKGNTVHLLYRAVSKGNYSSVGYARLEGPMKVVERHAEPVLFPEYAEDAHGVEDPRIVFFEGKYLMFYTAYDGKNARIGLAESQDLLHWKKCGIISPQITYRDAIDYFRKSKAKPSYFTFTDYLMKREGVEVYIWDKDAFIFPVRIKGKIALIHRILPDIQIAYARSLLDFQRREYWEKYLLNLPKHVVMENRYWFESRNIGAGGPVIKTKRGWLMIFHAVKSDVLGKAYSASAALLDFKNPQKVIARMQEPLFMPEKKWELKGDVHNVVFPTGNAVFDGRLYMYYGAADSRIAVASVKIETLLHELMTKWRCRQ